MDDLSAVEDVTVPGGFVISAAQLREQIAWAQRNGRANCFFQLWSSDDRNVMTVVDLYDDRWPTKSVTNDAEFVTRMAVVSGDNVIGDEALRTPIIYLDTEGNWDELRHREGHFACFRALGALDREDAIATVLALHDRESGVHGDTQ